MHILFCRHIWAELSLFFWTFLSRTFFPGGDGGGGGVHVHSVHPLAYAPDLRCVKVHPRLSEQAELNLKSGRSDVPKNRIIEMPFSPFFMPPKGQFFLA